MNEKNNFNKNNNKINNTLNNKLNNINLNNKINNISDNQNSIKNNKIKNTDKNINNNYNNTGVDFQNKNKLIEPYQYQTFLLDELNSNESLIVKNKKGGNIQNNKKEIIINYSPTDIYYNTVHEEYIPKTQNIPVKNKPSLSKTYQIESKDYFNNKNNLVSYSFIMTDLINKNK